MAALVRSIARPVARSIARREASAGGAISASIGGGFAISGVDTLSAVVSGLDGGETVAYQWTADAVDVSGATASTFAPSIGVNVSDADLIRCVVTVDGTEYTSNTRTVAYPAGSVTESAVSDWTIDDDALNVNLATDFTLPNLTGAFVMSGLPSGVVDDGDGSLSGTANGSPGAVNFTVTFTDQYGRGVVGSYSTNTVYRTQATATGGLGPLSFTVDSAITPQDLTTDFTANGNTLTYTISPALPSGLSLATNGALSGTPTVESASASYTVTAQDEYGRTTDSVFSLDTAYRTQATAAGALGPFSFNLDSAITPQDLSADFTANGNTLTYSVSPTLPSGLSLATNGILSGTPTVESASTSYTVTGQDEYGRTTTSAFSLEVVSAGSWTPADLFALGENGAWIEPNSTTAYTDTGRTTLAGVGDSVAAMDDLSGNGNHPTQPTASAQMTLAQPGEWYLQPDGVDDNFSFPLGAGFVGDFALILDSGPIFGSINTGGDATWGYTKTPAYIPDGNIHALIVLDRALTSTEKSNIVARYASAVTTTPGTARDAFRSRTDLTAIDPSGMDWTGVTDAAYTFRDCSSLTTPPDVSGWTSVTNAFFTFTNCSSITAPPDVSGWTSVTNAASTFRDCSSLTTPPDVSGWTSVTRSDAMFAACSALTSAINISSWNPLLLTNAGSMMSGVSAAGFDQTAYDAALTAWDAAYDLTLVNTTSAHFGSAQYGAGAPATARATLAANGWTITDGGAA